ncbi:hypothetical protein FS749_007818 [Ceratobasidium sp. UAMH 11750]|nr:hypothetical protein FS749_007818 [Ceratobasidium sp. UAMH 11750]
MSATPQTQHTVAPISSTRKTGGLWSYILPPTSSTSSSPPDPDATGQLPPSNSASLPATGPLDRSAVSVRLMLGDAKAALQQLSDRVERVVDEAANARREVAETGRGVEEAHAGMVKQVQTIVKQAIASLQEANVAHTSSLEATSARVANLEEALAAQARTISDLAQTCVTTQLNITSLLERTTQTHSAVLSLAPIFPFLQAIPTEIANAQLKTTSTVEHLQAETLRVARDARLELAKLSEEQMRATLGAVSELFRARDQAWREQMDAVVGHVKRDLERCREDWTSALSMHRQEVCGLLSVQLATCTHGYAQATAGTTGASSMSIARMDFPSNISPHTPQEEAAQPGQRDAPPPPSSTSLQVERSSKVDPANVPAQRASPEMVEEICGPDGSTSGASDSVAKISQEHGVRANGDTRQNQDHNTSQGCMTPNDTSSDLRDKATQPTLEPTLDPGIESQLSELSSLPDPDEDACEVEGSQDVTVEIRQADAPNGRLFGALNQPNRTCSANFDFSTPDSPPFSVHRQRLNVGNGPAASSQILPLASRPQTSTWVIPRKSNSTTAPSPGNAGAAQAPSLGHSAPSSPLYSHASHPPISTQQKRAQAWQRQSVAKRPKTRKLMTAEECAHGED